MNWSNPRSTPITFLPAFSLTANPNDSPGQKAKPILHPSFTIIREIFKNENKTTPNSSQQLQTANQPQTLNFILNKDRIRSYLLLSFLSIYLQKTEQPQ